MIKSYLKSYLLIKIIHTNYLLYKKKKKKIKLKKKKKKNN